MTLTLIHDKLAREAESRLRHLYYGPGLALPKHAVFEELDQARNMALARDWDGFDAAPMSPEAYQLARAFIFALPGNVCNPSEVDIDPHGRAIFEWDQDEESLKRVIVDPSGNLLVIVVGDGEPVAFRSRFDGALLNHDVVAVLCHEPSA